MQEKDQIQKVMKAWEYIIVTDLLKSFYQIPLSKESMKFCGVATPFKGIRLYTRCAMGMPISSDEFPVPKYTITPPPKRVRKSLLLISNLSFVVANPLFLLFLFMTFPLLSFPGLRPGWLQ